MDDSDAEVVDNSYDEEQASVVGTAPSYDVLVGAPCRMAVNDEASASMDTYEHDEAVVATDMVVELYFPCYEMDHRNQQASNYYSFGVGCSSFRPL